MVQNSGISHPNLLIIFFIAENVCDVMVVLLINVSWFFEWLIVILLVIDDLGLSRTFSSNQ